MTRSRSMRALRGLTVTALLLVLVWVGWNTGPAHHLGVPGMDVQAALGYGLLALVWRLSTASVRRRRTSCGAAP